MPDAMSRDPLREALRRVLSDFDRDPTEEYLDESERIFASALHAAGYRVVAAERETVRENHDRQASQGKHLFDEACPFCAAPTEEERQHE